MGSLPDRVAVEEMLKTGLVAKPPEAPAGPILPQTEIPPPPG